MNALDVVLGLLNGLFSIFMLIVVPCWLALYVIQVLQVEGFYWYAIFVFVYITTAATIYKCFNVLKPKPEGDV